jgi:acyl carrier protein
MASFLRKRLSVFNSAKPPRRPKNKGLLRMSDILERVRKIVIEHLDADPEKVTEKASFIDDLGADSLDNVELVMAFEEEFDIEIPDDAAEHIQTVGDAVKFIQERLGA